MMNKISGFIDNQKENDQDKRANEDIFNAQELSDTQKPKK